MAQGAMWILLKTHLELPFGERKRETSHTGLMRNPSHGNSASPAKCNMEAALAKQDVPGGWGLDRDLLLMWWWRLMARGLHAVLRTDQEPGPIVWPQLFHPAAIQSQ